MLASIPLKNDWPLNEIQESLMTLATGLQSSHRMESTSPTHHCRSSAVRCKTCHRKFHSLGNLENHHQLYGH
ncbi:hypothetical protein BY458DRAFT_429602 [Sporodiniella umbellata]|nr:hypothetical protein BY458DRAFT_429602 [Sporodiniella umbellata]